MKMSVTEPTKLNETLSTIVISDKMISFIKHKKYLNYCLQHNNSKLIIILYVQATIFNGIQAFLITMVYIL